FHGVASSRTGFETRYRPDPSPRVVIGAPHGSGGDVHAPVCWLYRPPSPRTQTASCPSLPRTKGQILNSSIRTSAPVPNETSSEVCDQGSPALLTSRLVTNLLSR